MNKNQISVEFEKLALEALKDMPKYGKTCYQSTRFLQDVINSHCISKGKASINYKSTNFGTLIGFMQYLERKKYLTLEGSRLKNLISTDYIEGYGNVANRPILKKTNSRGSLNLSQKDLENLQKQETVQKAKTVFDMGQPPIACPICGENVFGTEAQLNQHIDECLNYQMLNSGDFDKKPEEEKIPDKRQDIIDLNQDIDNVLKKNENVKEAEDLVNQLQMQLKKDEEKDSKLLDSIVTCPFEFCGQEMKAANLPDHCISNHHLYYEGKKKANTMDIYCPICMLVEEFSNPFTQNLIEHMNSHHADLITVEIPKPNKKRKVAPRKIKTPPKRPKKASPKTAAINPNFIPQVNFIPGAQPVHNLQPPYLPQPPKVPPQQGFQFGGNIPNAQPFRLFESDESSNSSLGDSGEIIDNVNNQVVNNQVVDNQPVNENIQYRISTLEKDLLEECVICFEEFVKGASVARLECLCLFHTTCIEQWIGSGANHCPTHTGSH